MADTSRINIMSLWSVVTLTAAACLWVFTNIAWASDIGRIESRLIKSDLRDLRRELEVAHSEETKDRIRDDIEEAIDALCDIKPDDRECN